jgi:GTPase SAR1 family protein
MTDSFNVRQKYTHFRVLVIGRANAGKTTILQRVCNTTEDPRTYNEGKNLVRFLSGGQ